MFNFEGNDVTLSLSNPENSALSKTTIFRNSEDLEISNFNGSFVENESPTKML